MRTVVIGMMLLWTTAALAQGAPPPYAVPVAAPPPVFRAVSSGPERVAAAVVPVTVRMTLGNQLLWSGPLNIGGVGQARISLSEPVADPHGCNRMGDGRMSRQIELSITAQNYRSANGADYRLSARYARPSDGGDCPQGTRTISIEQGFSLEGRKGLTFEGDGGLKVQISAP
ncbi:hypothetical protein [Sphingobium sp.]|uniref:hypothetical protein n=1 Tax=Sphingobium sp. TaxID=1912891 RepID=UPI003BB7D671